MKTFCTVKIPAHCDDATIVACEGDFATGDALADALIAKMSDQVTGWRHLTVAVQIEHGQVGEVTGAPEVRSFLRQHFQDRKPRSQQSLYAAAMNDMVAAAR